MKLKKKEARFLKHLQSSPSALSKGITMVEAETTTGATKGTIREVIVKGETKTS